MAENLPIEEEKKTYPRRQKKSLFDDDTWEISTSRKDRKNKRSVVIEDSKYDENNNKNVIKPACRKCLIVLKDKNELAKHEAVCLLPAKKESFLKLFPRKPENPRFILEKIVIPSS